MWIRGDNEGDDKPVVLHRVRLMCELVNDPIDVGAIPKLPAREDFDLSLGNEVAGTKVKVTLILVGKPEMTQIKDQTDETADILPSCVETRAVEGKQAAGVDDAVTLEDTCVFSDDLSVNREPRGSEESRDEDDACDKRQENESGMKEEGTCSSSAQSSRGELEGDKEQGKLFKEALPETVVEEKGRGYFLREDIMMRKWTSPKGEKSGNAVTEIVVPQGWKMEVILRMAHERVLAVQLEVKKPYQKAIQRFFWPEIT